MHKLLRYVNVLCWTMVVGFVAGSVAYVLYVPYVFRHLWCANTLTDPLAILLSCVAPAAGGAVVTLGVLWLRGLLGGWIPALAGVLCLVTLAVLLAYGSWLFRTILPSHPLSEVVWWLRLL